MVVGEHDSEDEESSDEEDKETPKNILAWRFNLYHNVNEFIYKM